MKTVSLTEQQVSSIRNYALKQNLSLFTKHLGYDNAPFHEEWYDLLQNKFSPIKKYPNRLKKYLLLWPRGHAKTTATTFNYVSWLVGNYPNIHVNIVTKTASLAEEILTALITRFEIDDKYKQVFGELKPRQTKKWTNREIIVDRTEISKDPTLKATGLMGPITGGRSDLIVCDDIIDEENIRTNLQLEKVSTWFNKVLIPTLYPWGGIVVIGTRWSYADIYAGLLQKWPYDVKHAIKLDMEGHETNEVLWPEYWSLEKLEQRRNEIGSVFFSCQYQNDPTSMEGNKLKSWMLHSWNEQRPDGTEYGPPPANCQYYAALDPSLGENDYFGIAILAYDPIHNQAYLIDVLAEHHPFPDIIKTQIPLLHSQYKFLKMFMETNFWQKLLINMPELRGLPIVPVQTVRNKEERFIPMSSHFESKRVLVNPLINQRTHEFWTEWVQFPRGQHDDALDCVEIVVTKVMGSKFEPWVKGIKW